MRIFLILLLFSLSTINTNASVGFDLSLNGTGDNLNIKSHLFMMTKLSNSVQFGPIAFIERPEELFVDGIVGLGIRFGKSFFLELDGGYYAGSGKNKLGTFKPRGFAAALIPGLSFKNFRITFPITVKRIEKGDNKKWDAEFIPYIGYEF